MNDLSTYNLDIFSDRDVWVFDLDNTLYPAEADLFAQIDLKMGEYIQKLLSLSPDKARKVQKTYLLEEGTTLRGLMNYHDVDPYEFLDFVHDIDMSPISPDPKLRTSLKKIDGRKVIFTNADLPYAKKVLARLGIEDMFEGIFDIHAADLVPKPAISSYHKFLKDHDINPEHAIMFEDMARNLVPAHQLGMATVWINTKSIWGEAGHDPSVIHAETHSLSRWLADFLQN